MSPVIERVRVEFPCGPAGPADSALNVTVIFTSIDATLSALRRAGALASRLHSRITLIVPQVVADPLPLTKPPVPTDFTERYFRVLADRDRVETVVRIYLCRDRIEALRDVLKPHSLVVIGNCRRWWPTAEKLLARQLQRAGHEVVFV
jgi:hypothetical protein